MDMDVHSAAAVGISGTDLGRRRRWSVAEKLRIVEESLSGHRQASVTARRYGIPNSLLFRWRKAYREGCVGGAGLDGFVPAVIVPESVAAAPSTFVKASADRWSGNAGHAGGRMEVVSAGGRRVVVGPDFDPQALRLLLAVLEQPR